MRPRSDTLYFWTGASCSYGCGACPIEREHAAAGSSPTELQLADLARQPGRLVVLVGGDPFLRQDLPRLLAIIRAAGCRAGIVSSGRALLYPRIRELLRRSEIAYLRVQLFGLGEAHDRITGVTGGYQQALDGVRAWLAEGQSDCDLDVALSGRGRSSDALAIEAEALARTLASPAVQLLISADHSQVEIDAAELASVSSNSDPARPLVVWEGLVDPPELALAVASPSPEFIGVGAHASCLGAVRPHHRSPPPVRANSFNFVRSDRTVPFRSDAAACTAYAAGAPIAPARQLWLIEGERLALHSTDTGDFEDAAIARVKDEWSHLFIDLAPPGVLDDFRDGMRRVLPDPVCDGCHHRSECGRRFRAIEGAPFERQERWIADYVSRLRGCVLDVGCGEQLYRQQLAPLLRSGTVDYTGLDPDETSLRHASQALPEGRFWLGDIEQFHSPPRSYDHVLCLRSLNHVLDLDEAIGRMTECLKPGGTLLLVECTPFAMLRRSEQVIAADHAPRAGHQHLRNLASEEVLPFARRRSLRVLEHQPQGLDGTNQWVLLLTHADPQQPRTVTG